MKRGEEKKKRKKRRRRGRRRRRRGFQVWIAMVLCGFVKNHVGYLIWEYEYLLGVRNPRNFPSCVYVWVMNHFGVVLGGFHGGF